jgi:tetratricopeptide (TPR) repeat protein
MRHLIKAIALVAIVAAMHGARAEEWNGCDSPEPERKIAACTKLIETPGIAPVRLAGAFVRRGFGYLKLGQYQRAIRDYDETIRTSLLSEEAVALNYRAIAYNNRAVAYDRLGKPSQALSDAEKAVQFAPREPTFYATRGAASQSLSDQQGAIRDHDAAMALGGTRWIKFYQCGLRLAQLYHGPIDGVLRPELHTALRMCVDKGRNCDPVHPNPECPEPVG